MKKNQEIHDFGFVSYFRHQRNAWKNNYFFDEALIFFGVVCWCVAALLFSIDGHHTGFFTTHRLGHYIAPSALWANITFLGDTLAALSIVLFFVYRKPQITLAVLIGAIITTIWVHSLKHGVNS